MRLIKKYQLRLSKSENTGDVFRKIVQALHELDTSFTPTFYVEDPNVHSVSAVDRLIKKFPALKKHEGVEVQTGTNLDPSKYLSTLGEGWTVKPQQGTGEFPLPVLEAIAEGIPRAYPAHKATFVFDHILWNEKGTRNASCYHKPSSPDFPYDYHCPSIILQSNWWISGRVIQLWATVELDVPAEGCSQVSEPGEKVQQCLQRLGPIQKEWLIIVPSPEEEQEQIENKAKAEAITKYYDIGGESWREASLFAVFPHRLPDPNKLDREEAVSPKKVINQQFKPRGYQYRSEFSGNGIYHLVKKLPSHNLIVLEFDFTPIGKYFSCDLYVKGLLWKHKLTVRMDEGVLSSQYPIRSAEVLDMVVANIAAAVDFLEKEYVSKLVDIYGSSPEWFNH